MTLLPGGSTSLELALEATDAARSLPIGVVRDGWDPWRCPAANLGYLAWAFSIDLWDDAWPDLKKRSLCAEAIALHRLKGTLAGVRAHLALVGATVTRAIRPPARGFLGSAQTGSTRASALAALPQLRIYPFLHRSTARGYSFYRAPRPHPILSSFDGSGWDFSASAPRFDRPGRYHDQLVPAVGGVRPLGLRDVHRRSRVSELTGLRTTIVDRGIETTVSREQLGNAIRFLPPGAVRRGWHGRGFAGADWRQASTAAGRVVTLHLVDVGQRDAARPGLEPLAVTPTRRHEGRMAPGARAFFGRMARRRFLCSSYAPWLVYDQVPLYRADRAGQRRQTRSFHGAGRYGIAPFTAELRVAVPLHRAHRRGGRWHGAGFRAAADLTPVARAIEAVRVSRALRDTVLIDTTHYRPVQFGSGLRFGDFTFGALRKAA